MNKHTCRVEDCTKPVRVMSRELCAMHNWRWLTYGSVTLPERPPVFRPCAIEGCDRSRRRNGYCTLHDERIKRNGTIVPLVIQGDDEPRFLQYVTKTDTCWLWTGVTNRRGYSCFTLGRRNVLGHRWSYEHFVGPIPEGLTIDHLCYVHNCVRPSHLEPVTISENVRRATEHYRLLRTTA